MALGVNLNTAMVLRATDANGKPVSGAKLTVFEDGTATAVTTYADEALITANPAPIVSDSAGAFGPIFLPPGTYKVDITTSAGVSLPGYPEDDISVDWFNGPEMASRDEVTTTTIPAAVEFLRTAGYAAPGDGGGHLYVRNSDGVVRPGDIVSADGARWQIAPSGEVETARDVIESTSMTYENTLVGSTIRTRAEGFAYKVAAEDALDAHVSTAGGVKLYVLPTGGVLHASAWGAGGNPLADDTAACISMVSALDSGMTLDIDVMLYPDGETDWPEIVRKHGVSVVSRDGCGFTVNKPHHAEKWRALIFTDCDGVVVRGLRGKGGRQTNTATAGENGMGLTLYGCRKVTVDDCHFQDYWGDGFYIGSLRPSRDPAYGPDTRDPCRTVMMTNCTSLNNRRQGLSVIALVDGSFIGCDFSGTNGTAPEAGVDLEPNDPRELIQNLSFIDCTMTDNAGAGLATAGPLDDSKGLIVSGCKMVGNFYGLSSIIKDTQVRDCLFDGSKTTIHYVGGAHVRYGSVVGCTFRGLLRAAVGFTGSDGHLVVQGNICEYTGRDFPTNPGGNGEFYFVYSEATGGRLTVRDNPHVAVRSNNVRLDGGPLDYLEISGNNFQRHHDGTFGSTFPLRIASPASSLVRITNNTFLIPAGSAIDGVIISCDGDTDYLIENNNVTGWARTRTDWYSQGAGVGSIDFGAGNILPSGEFGREQSWEAGYIRMGAYALWVDGSGKLRIKDGTPSSDTDGVVVGA